MQHLLQKNTLLMFIDRTTVWMVFITFYPPPPPPTKNKQSNNSNNLAGNGNTVLLTLLYVNACKFLEHFFKNLIYVLYLGNVNLIRFISWCKHYPSNKSKTDIIKPKTYFLFCKEF